MRIEALVIKNFCLITGIMGNCSLMMGKNSHFEASLEQAVSLCLDPDGFAIYLG